MAKKTKLKAKGKRYYQNTHGTVCRVRLSPKLRKLEQQKKILRTMDSNVG